MTYLLFHILDIGIEYMPAYFYQIPKLFRFATCHSISIVLGDFCFVLFWFFFLCWFVSKVSTSGDDVLSSEFRAFLCYSLCL